VSTVTPVVSYDCGCGFRVVTWREAEAHAQQTHHQLTIHGRVVVERPDEPMVTPPPRKGSRGQSDDLG
jgi:hypothetical protein